MEDRWREKHIRELFCREQMLNIVKKKIKCHRFLSQTYLDHYFHLHNKLQHYWKSFSRRSKHTTCSWLTSPDRRIMRNVSQGHILRSAFHLSYLNPLVNFKSFSCLLMHVFTPSFKMIKSWRVCKTHTNICFLPMQRKLKMFTALLLSAKHNATSEVRFLKNVF